jgi:hypothetical protein
METQTWKAPIIMEKIEELMSKGGDVDVNEVLETAKAKGMFMVSEDTIGELATEFETTCVEVDRLCELVDPETAPYDSKYKARDIIDKLVNRLEASRTVAQLEKRVETIAQADWRIGALRIRLGSIDYEVDEPHNAQTDLELAAAYYFPQFAEAAKYLTADEDEDVGKRKDGENRVSAADVDLLEVPALDLPKPKSKSVNLATVHIDALKCLNMMGILWAGRARVRKSFIYLRAAKDLYERIKSSAKDYSDLKASHLKDLENTYTHSLFYLAQAYGHIGDAEKSSACCHETLQRQHDAGLTTASSKLEWAKNCAAMADFYISSLMYRRASMALLSAECIVRSAGESLSAGDASDSDNLKDIQADLNRRFVGLDSLILKRAKDRYEAIANAVEFGIEWTEDEDIEMNELAASGGELGGTAKVCF